METEMLYEKCRVLIGILTLSRTEIGDGDREAVVDMLSFFYERLGESIGILKK